MTIRPKSLRERISSLSIKRKLSGIVLLASGFALFAASVTIVLLDRVTAKEAMIRDSGTLADMIVATSTAAVAFSSPEDADEILSSLRFRPDVVAAEILDIEGGVFAGFHTDTFVPSVLSAEFPSQSEWFSGDRLHLSRPILLNNKVLGTFVLTMSTELLEKRLSRWVSTIILISAMALLVAFLITSKLHKVISGPIGNLVDVATRVSKTKDYSIRATSASDDEVGALVESFNEMLKEVGQRDEALSVAHDTLEVRVHERTDELEQEITIREHAEEALVAQRTFLRQIIDTNPNLIFVKDREGRFELVNQATADLYGTTVDDVTGKTDAYFGVPDAEQRSFRKVDIEVMDSQKEVIVSEEPVTNAAGHTRWLQIIKRPLISGDGTCTLLLGVATDITARKEAEMALRASEEQLRQAVKMEAVGRLADGVAHDFNNLLAVIMGRSELLEATMGTGHPLLAPVLEIDKAAQRAAELTKQLLAFSRRQVLEAKPMNLNACVQNMDTMLRRIIGEDIKFNSVLGQTPNSVFADPGQIEQVLMNLVINARDAIHGGGSITIQTGSVFLPEPHSKIEGDVIPGAYVFISVGDTGSGMDEATRSRIFEPFFTTKALGKGTGLGLSTVYGIVKQSGGHLDVKSQVGFGTTITIYLPRTEAELFTEPEEVQAAPIAEGGQGQTILVVEDQVGVRELVRQTLELSGYRVLAAENGDRAIAISKNQPGEIDLVISDVVMPGLSGPDTVERLLKMNPALRVIYMSGYVNENILGSSAAFLQKPFRIDALRGAVATALAPHELVNAE